MMNTGINLKDQQLPHGLQDTYGVRLGGSYVIPADKNSVIVRGGIAYDTAAAKKGWERADLDGAARTMLAGGGSYKISRWQLDAGAAVILEGSRTENRNCNPNSAPGMQGCSGGMDANVPGWSATGPYRVGPDPLNPLVVPAQQKENPVNQGTIVSHYLMFMLGASTHF
jgi:long-subunit fatty acid transport protein